MTDAPADTTADEPANSNFAVLNAIAELGTDATPAAIAAKVGIAYSTVNPKLRAWENAGLAERFRHDTGQTVWRLTDAGRTSTATPPQFIAASSPDPGTPTAVAPAAPDPAPEDTALLPLHPPAVSDDTPVDGDESQTPVSSAEPPGADPAVDDPTGGDNDAEATESHPHGAEQASSGGLKTTADPADSPLDPGTAPAPATAASPPPDAPVPDEPAAAVETPEATAAPAKRKRPAGSVRASALAIMAANPGREYTIDQLTKLIDQADAGTGYPRVSSGAVANAVTKLAGTAGVEQVEDRKAATFRMVPAAD